MGQVIGPIETDDWYVLLMLRKSLNFMHDNNVTGRFKFAIHKETALYKEFKDKYLKEVA
jgi:hypothetical protein